MEKESPTIKIFVTYKNRNKIIKSDIITPIQTGRAIADEVFEEMIGDDTGDNISDRNPKYSELTAQYWAWKNYDKIGNPDYIGFMHYRRHFIFNDKKYAPDAMGMVSFDRIDDDYLEKNNIYNSDAIRKYIDSNDIIVGNPVDCRRFSELKHKHPRDAFCYNSDLHAADYDLMNTVVEQLYPEYKKTINMCEHGYKQYWYNMFIMRREVFFKYCRFWWSVINVLEKKIDTTMYPENALRILGYLSERLLGLFIMHECGNYKIKEAPMAFIKNTYAPPAKILPAFEKNNIPVVLISSNYFAPYLTTVIQSILDNASKDKNYDLIVLTRDMSDENQYTIKTLYGGKNVSVRFHKIVFEGKFHTTDTISIETYIRLRIPEIFSNYKKVVYIDCDVAVNADVAELYDSLQDDGVIAAVHDFTMQSFVSNSAREDYSYVRDKLNISNEFSLFNGGVMVFNIDKIPQDFFERTRRMCLENRFLYLDQDAMNIYFQDKIHYLDFAWNFTPITLRPEIIKFLPYPSKLILQAAVKAPKIVHYNSPVKPWIYPASPLAFIWWKYARKTPFYEEILLRMNMANKGEVARINKSRAQIRFKRRLYRILKHLTAGRAHKTFKKKYNRYNQLYKSL